MLPHPSARQEGALGVAKAGHTARPSLVNYLFVDGPQMPDRSGRVLPAFVCFAHLRTIDKLDQGHWRLVSDAEAELQDP